mgnify:FL=1
MSSIVIIPARGGSKRIPKKNIRDFCGKPMIAYSIETALETNIFDEIHVSSDCDETISIAQEYGVTSVFKRPLNLADDKTPLLPVVRWVLTEYRKHNKEFNNVFLLMPCAPLIKADLICKAYELYLENDREVPVLSVAKYPVPVEWGFNMGEDKVLTEREPGSFLIRSQDISKAYFDAGVFAVFPSKIIMNPDYMGGGKMLGAIIPPHLAIDIDEPDDLTFAEIVYKGLEHVE